MKKIFLGILIFIFVLVVSFFIINYNMSKYSSSTELILSNSAGTDITSSAQNLSQTPTNSNSSSSNSGKIDLATLALHASSTDCWVVYKSKVYDVTAFITNHPGGESPIAKTCGTTNFESAFQRQHGTSKASMFMKVTTYKGDFAI